MHTKDLLALIRNYNSQKDELFYKSSDILLSGIRNELEAIYNRGSWAQMVDVTQFGISIKKISSDFQQFDFDITGGYLMRFGETLCKDYEFITMQEFFDAGDFAGQEICGFTNNDILQLKPFCQALEAKGAECYADPENGQLVLAICVQ